MKIGDLKVDLRSKLDNFGTVEFAMEWVFGFYKFSRVPRCMAGVDFLS